MFVRLILLKLTAKISTMYIITIILVTISTVTDRILPL